MPDVHTIGQPPKLRASAKTKTAAKPKNHPENRRRPLDGRPERELTETQQLVCNLAADLIMNGGQDGDLDMLLSSLISHSMHLRSPGKAWWDLSCVGHTKTLARWKRQIVRGWSEPSSPREEEPSQTVSEMARANVRGNIRSRLDEFLGGARIHELYLLDNVLGTFESANGGSADERAECVLAEAFMCELGSDSTFIKVSRDQLEAVEEYIAGLNAVPDEAEQFKELVELWRQDHPQPTTHPSGHLGREEDDDEE